MNDPESELEAPPDQKEFLEKFWQLYQPTGSFDELLLLWHAITTFALDWLVNEKKELSLGFATIVPLPYRPNWKDLKLENDGSLLETDPLEGLVRWNLEIVALEAWETFALKSELKRYTEEGPFAHAQFVLNFCQNALSRHQQMVETYRRKISHPPAVFRPSREGGGTILLPKTPDVDRPSRSKRWKQKQAPVAKEDESLPAVSYLLPPPEDLRQSTG